MIALDPTDAVRRDRWGRYLVVPPEGGKPVGYTRATTVAKALDDQANLLTWSNRMTALGLAQRPDLLALVQAADPDDRAELNKVCERAKEAGGATARRDLGTALHSMIERSHADPTFIVPEPYAGDVAAVKAAIDAAGYDVVVELSEAMVVLDRHRIAGTSDLTLRRRCDGVLRIADIKTGAASSIAYGHLAWSIQLAIYAHADALYSQGAAPDGMEDVRLPMRDVDHATALIVHVEPGSARCDLHVLDIAAGAEALELAVTVRDWRKRKGLLVPMMIEGGGTTSHTEPRQGAAREQVVGSVERPTTTAAAPVTPVPDPDAAGARVVGAGQADAAESSLPAASADPRPLAGVLDAVVHQARVAWVRNRIEAVKAHGGASNLLAGLWPLDVPRPKDTPGGPYNWTPAQLAAIVGTLDHIEAAADLPFGDEDPATAVARTAEAERRATLDAERMAEATDHADPEAVSWLRQVLAQMTTDEQAQVLRWIGEADTAHPWKMAPDGQPTPRRRHAIAAAALELAQLAGNPPGDDTAPRSALALVIGEDAAKPALAVGALLGTLTIAQAGQLEQLCRAYRVAVDEAGTPALVAVA
jgi:hypothetical protein